MPTEVGKIDAVTFTVESGKDVPLGKSVVGQFEEYREKCPTIRIFMAKLAAVTVVIKLYRGSGAVTIHRTKKVVVSNTMSKEEAAESVLFELVNWSQGDFATREQGRLKNAEITPEQAGKAIATCEAYSVHTHGQFMQEIKSKGIALSKYGEAQRAETSSKELDEVVSATMASPHDKSAKSDDMMSLKTPHMYWYQTINGVADADITIRAIRVPPQWLQDCIKEIWKFNDLLGSFDGAGLYVKLLNLAKEAKCDLVGGFEFTAPMKTVAKEMTVGPPPFQMSMRGLTALKGMPGNLTDMLKAVKFLS